jgi:trehalose-6-phosphate synthase
VVARARRIRHALRTELVILGVDRLDYTKGILERLLGYERFLEANPAWHKRVTLVLIAVPSRTKVADYAMLKRQLDEQVGRIVGRFSSEGWLPLCYLYTQFGAEELVAYYRCADVALLTPSTGRKWGVAVVSKVKQSASGCFEIATQCGPEQ